MKAKLTFDLPEERDEFALATNAGKMWSVLWEIDQEMRSLLKHGELDDNTFDVLDKLRDRLYDEMSSHGISFDMVD